MSAKECKKRDKSAKFVPQISTLLISLIRPKLGTFSTKLPSQKSCWVIYGIFTHKKRTYSLGSFLNLEMVGVEPTSIVDKN